MGPERDCTAARRARCSRTCCARHDPGPASFVARLTVELLRPVPLAPLQAVARTIRPGRKVQWLEGMLLADGVEVARATVLRLRPNEVDVSGLGLARRSPRRRPSTGGAPPPSSSSTGSTSATGPRTTSGSSRGGFGAAGPATAWFRLQCPVVAGEPVAPFERVAAAADFGSGIGNPLTFTTRVGDQSRGERSTRSAIPRASGSWLESGGWAAAHGVGLAETTLHDERGLLGRAAQTLLVSPIGAAAAGPDSPGGLPPQP